MSQHRMKTRIRATIESGTFTWEVTELDMYVVFDGHSYTVWEWLEDSGWRKPGRKLSESIMRKRLRASNIELALF